MSFSQQIDTAKGVSARGLAFQLILLLSGRFGGIIGIDKFISEDEEYRAMPRQKDGRYTWLILC